MQISTVVVRKVRLSVIALVASALTGCATSSSSPPSDPFPAGAPTTAQLTSDFSRSKLIAADFVSTMAQLPESQPSLIVLHIKKPSSRFGEVLLSALQSAGYDLRVGDPKSQNWLGYNAHRDDTLSDAGNPVYTFFVSAGEVKLKRSYEVDRNGVKPAGSMFVRGATTDGIVLDDSIFSARRPNAVAKDRKQNQSIAQTVSPSQRTFAVSAITLHAVPSPASIVATDRTKLFVEVRR